MVNHGKHVTIWFVNSLGWFLKPTIKAISSKILILCFDERFGSGSPRDSRFLWQRDCEHVHCFPD